MNLNQLSYLLKPLHTLAVGLWFGTTIFFTLTGIVVFGTFADLTRQESAERPTWLPVAALYEGPSPGKPLRDPLRLEQGSRIAGAVVGPLFPIYFGLQTGCAILALLTTLIFVRAQPSRLGNVRLGVLILASCGVGLGWWMERVVHELRGPRNHATDNYLASLQSEKASTQVRSAETPTQEESFRRTREQFDRWHGYSLITNLATLLLVALATGLAGYLPEFCRRPGSSLAV